MAGTMDDERSRKTAHEYLIRLAETKTWLEMHLDLELPPTTELQNYFRTGVVLAQLGNFIAPDVMPSKKIYDLHLTAFKKKGLHYKYSDNICGFVAAMGAIGFPKIFYPETTDIYDMKNIPKLVYCLHALTMYLVKLGIASPLQDLTGKVDFTEQEILEMSQNLQMYGIQMPAFSKIGGILAKELSVDDAAMHAAIFAINDSLKTDDNDNTFTCLSKPATQLRHVILASKEDYIPELKNAYLVKLQCYEQSDKSGTEDVYDKLLTKDEIQAVLDRINIAQSLKNLTEVSRDKNSDKFFSCLSAKELGVPLLSYDARDLYEQNFFQFVNSKDSSYVLTMNDVNDLVATCNVEVEERKRVLKLIDELNKGVFSFNEDQLFQCLQKSKILSEHLEKNNSNSYLQMLQKTKREKQNSTDDSDAYLWFNEIKKCIKKTNTLVDSATRDLNNLRTIHEMAPALTKNQKLSEFTELIHKLNMKGILDDFEKDYASSFTEALAKQNMEDWNGWTEHKISDYENVIYYNYKTCELLWDKKPEFNSSHGYLNKDTIQAILIRVSDDGNKQKFFMVNAPSIRILQSYWRTLQLHKGFVQRPKICLLGAYFKTLHAYSRHTKIIKSFVDAKPDVSVLQSFVRTILSYAPYQKRVKYFMKHINKIVALQSIIRAGQAHVHYSNIIHDDTPTLKSISKFARLLEFDANDMREEIEISNLKSLVLKKITLVNKKESEIKEMDVKIGLLVKNRLNLQDVLDPHRSKLKNKNQIFLAGNTKEKNEIFRRYGIFFYVLQMNPEYCSKLIMSFIGKRNDIFITHTCYALFNYGANIRDEYSITKMFARSLQLEITTNIDNLQEFTTGDPLVIKMVITFYRNSKAQLWITELFQPIIKDILNNKYSINTNPLELYKQWINSIETQTGKSAELPYDIDAEKALEYPEVVKILSENVKNMKEVCTVFVKAITSCESKLPYGIRYIARVLFHSLTEKFPEESEKNKLKIVGHMVYFKLLNPVIVSPDLYNIVSTAEISAEKRKTLGAISSVLQKSAYRNFTKPKKGKSNDLKLDDFYEYAWKKMSAWYKSCIDVEEIDNHYNIDEYTDQSAIKRPELTLSVGQIIETHRIVDEYAEALCPDKNCVLYKVLKEFEKVPKPENLVDVVGKQENSEVDDTERDMMKEVVIRLELIAPMVEESNETVGKRLISETVRLVADILQYYNTENLSNLLNANFSDENELSYKRLQRKRTELEATMFESFKGIDDETFNEAKESLNMNLVDVRNKLKKNLTELEKLGMCKASDDYIDIVHFMAKEIKNRKLYRKNRRFDLLRLRGALENLNCKEKYLHEQMESYEAYVKACTQNLGSITKKTKKQGTKKIVAKYSAHKLHQKGVILEIDGVTASQLKNVSFEISSTDDPGVFAVNAKLFGVSMETVDIVFQDLLQLQYENVPVMRMFEKAKLNVNLLIFTINKKFYNKR